MHAYLVKRIAVAVTAAVPMNENYTREDVERAISEEFKDEDMIVWSVGDIQQDAEDAGGSISEDDARNLLHQMIRKHDASIGVSWDTIRVWVDDYLADKKGD